MKIVVIDGQGGGFGRALIDKLRAGGIRTYEDAVAMIKAGASAGATGENAVIVNARRADVIAGPLGIVMANSMMGECSPAMALAVADSPARKVLIPVSKCGVQIGGLPELPLADYIADAARRILSMS